MQTRYAKQISTGKIIQSQSGGTDADLETVKQNALNSGYAPDDIEVGWMDADECYKKQTEQDFEAMEYTNKRKLEYPTIEECIHAILDGELDALQAKRKLVKDKYPKE